MAGGNRVCGPTQCGIIASTTRRTKGGCKPDVGRCMPGANLSRRRPGKAPLGKPALQPYWGKPAVRNDRGDRGNVGIIRSPVRVGDAVAVELGAAAVAVLIGERPGLSSPDSMSIYLTWRPSVETSDAARNCVSNIRPEGTSYAEAGFKLFYLLRKMRARGFSGVALKDDSEAHHAHPYRIPPNITIRT